MNVVAAIPRPANANPISIAAGRQRIAHGELVRPRIAIVARNAPEYAVPRAIAQPISPSAMSVVPRGVASMASKVFAYLYLKKKLNVVSNTDPFIAEPARSPGATNTSYGTALPPKFTVPT